MNPERRNIIVKEIEYWRSSRLLADQYCDFLLNLYKDNDEEQNATSAKSKPALSTNGIRVWIISFVIISICVISLINFNSFPPVLQILISIFIVMSLGIFGFVKRSNMVLFYSMTGLAAISMLFLGQYLLRLHGWTDLWMIGYLIFCGLIWLGIGLIGSVMYLHFCGWISLLLCYGWLIYTKVDQLNLFMLELAWLPLSFLFVWLGWALLNKSRRNSIVFFLLGILLWFIPEVYGILWTSFEQVALQGLFIGKLLIASTFLFVTRNIWMNRTI